MTYTRWCEKCGEEFEIERSINDDSPVKCAKCGSEKTRAVITGGNGFVLLGDGWAKDNYAKGTQNK